MKNQSVAIIVIYSIFVLWRNQIRAMSASRKLYQLSFITLIQLLKHPSFCHKSSMYKVSKDFFSKVGCNCGIN